MTETLWLVKQVDRPGSLLISRPNLSISSSKTEAFSPILQLRFHIGLWTLMSPAIKTLPHIIGSQFTYSKAFLMQHIPLSQIYPLLTCSSYKLITCVFLPGVLDRVSSLQISYNIKYWWLMRSSLWFTIIVSARSFQFALITLMFFLSFCGQ